ncbi:hypothetical protein [Rhizobium sp. Root482]|jgi:hypothetical protein|uniref:hypothetical protein n=1 Tax=Rhizobium sp. Root482 TaxID=1736543 RepID=UPI00138ECA49|nr:hypothetical protein [Rhizobium sp. Root482]
MEKLGTRKNTRERFVVKGFVIGGSMRRGMSHLSRGRPASRYLESDIGMDGRDGEGICDLFKL